MKSKKLLVVIVGCVFIMLLVACGNNSTNTNNSEGSSNEESNNSAENSNGNVITFKLAENQPDDNPVTIAMNKFAELVNEKSNGEIEIDVYANGQLGEETDNIDQVQSGALDMARVNSVPVAEIVKELGAFTLPYIFIDQDHKYKVLDGDIGQEILGKFEEHDMVSFGYLEAGSRHFYTTDKPIKSVADMKGMKLRVQPSDISVKMVELLGAVPTPMDYGEVFTSLQTGVIDGAENDFVSYYTSGHYEVAKHFTLDGHLSPPALIIMNKDKFDELSEEHKQIIQEAADEAIEFEREEMNKSQDEFRAEVEESGTEIYDVDIQEFQDAVAPIYEELTELSDLIDRITKVK